MAEDVSVSQNNTDPGTDDWSIQLIQLTAVATDEGKSSDPHTSPPPDFEARNSRKFYEMYLRIYGIRTLHNYICTSHICHIFVALFVA